MARNLARFLALLCCLATSCMAGAVSPDDLWSGHARFEYVRDLEWPEDKGGGVPQQATWFVARNGAWYAFSRDALAPVAGCPFDHGRVIVHASRDQGKTWGPGIVIVEPGQSRAGDGCAVVDGSSYFDAETGIWHILAQCLDRENVGGWALCHYSRKAATPLGRFAADPHNPVVRGGALWSQICAGPGKACDPANTHDEGTPDIVEKRNGLFYVSFHGYNPNTKSGYRGIAATPDFERWTVSGAGLPNDAVLSARDCAAWVRNCIGVGESSTLLGSEHAFQVVEAMDKDLACTTGQKWIFQVVRTPRGSWPRSGSGMWRSPTNQALLERSWSDPNTPCGIGYAHWLKDGPDIFLIFEEWEPGRSRIHRRLLKLVRK